MCERSHVDTSEAKGGNSRGPYPTTEPKERWDNRNMCDLVTCEDRAFYDICDPHILS